MNATENNPLATPDGLVTWLNGRRTVGCKGECLLSQYLLHATGRRANVTYQAWWPRSDSGMGHVLEPWAAAVARGYDRDRAPWATTMPACLAREIVAAVLIIYGLDASGVKR